MRTGKIVKLGSADLRLLAAYEQHAEESFSVIARNVRSKEHAIRYRFHALRQRGVILERVPFVDMYRLGCTVFKIYCEIAPEKQNVQQKLITYLTKSKNVMWIAQVGGPYQIVFSVCVKRMSEIDNFLGTLTNTIGAVFNQTDLIIQLRMSAFGRKYLAPEMKPGKPLRFGANSEDTFLLDDLDSTLLSTLCHSDLASERAIAEQLRMPLTTLRRRLRNLEHNGVIPGYIFRYNLAAIGLNRFNLLIKVKGLSTLVAERMHEFCARHSRIVNLSECLGSWQFEMTVEVESAADTVSIIREIGEHFGSEVSQITTIPIFRSFKYVSYPQIY